MTKHTIKLKQCFENLVFYKMCSQNAVNAISGIQILKFFSAFGTSLSFPPIFHKVSATGQANFSACPVWGTTE
jgi:hypothetical protein